VNIAIPDSHEVGRVFTARIVCNTVYIVPCTQVLFELCLLAKLAWLNLVRKKELLFRAMSPHFFLHALTRSQFIKKAVCLVPRVVDERFCPPDGPHDIKDYPIFYDRSPFPSDEEYERHGIDLIFCS